MKSFSRTFSCLSLQAAPSLPSVSSIVTMPTDPAPPGLQLHAVGCCWSALQLGSGGRLVALVPRTPLRLRPPLHTCPHQLPEPDFTSSPPLLPLQHLGHRVHSHCQVWPSSPWPFVHTASSNQLECGHSVCPHTSEYFIEVRSSCWCYIRRIMPMALGSYARSILQHSLQYTDITHTEEGLARRWWLKELER